MLNALLGVFAMFVVSRRRRKLRHTGAWLSRRLGRIASLLASRPSAGALVSRIGAGSPAEKAGLQIGDVVIRFAGHKVSNSAQLRSFVAAVAAGMDAKVDVMRNGRRKSFVVTIEGAPPLDTAPGPRTGS